MLAFIVDASPQVQAALIAAFVSLATITVGELFLSRRARRARKANVRETYQKYIDPLARSSVDLFWRLCEISDTSGYGFYLKGESRLTSFEHYKALSTLYRLASLLGWIRALRRELMFLPSHSRKAQESLDAALIALGSALAEGGEVEKRRVEALMRLWTIDNRHCSPDQVRRAGVSIDATLKNYLHNANVKNATDLDVNEKFWLTRLVADKLTAAIGQARLSDEVTQETCHRAVEALTIREAWVYRDWQAAIGDTMLKPAPDAPRLFEVIGYKEFEALINHGDEEERKWLRRLNAVIWDLDIQGDPSKDARIEQLQAIHRANIEIIEAIQITDKDKTRVSEGARRKIGEVLNELG